MSQSDFPPPFDRSTIWTTPINILKNRQLETPEYVLRMSEELSEIKEVLVNLKIRKDKLKSFLKNPEKLEDLTYTQKSLLEEQLEAMKSSQKALQKYIDILERRIENEMDILLEKEEERL